MTDPSTAEEWMAVARERGRDAQAMQDGRSNSVGPAYMAGYAVESALKAFLQSKGIPRPLSGAGGHNLTSLWKATGLPLGAVNDSGNGAKTFFLQSWSTDLRYQSSRPSHVAGAAEVVDAACQLMGFLSSKLKRAR
jgi:hypothetical protein